MTSHANQEYVSQNTMQANVMECAVFHWNVMFNNREITTNQRIEKKKNMKSAKACCTIRPDQQLIARSDGL